MLLLAAIFTTALLAASPHAFAQTDPENPGTDIGASGGSRSEPASPSGGSKTEPASPSGGSRYYDGPSGGPSTDGTTFYIQSPLKFNNVGELVNGVIEIFTYLVILLAVLMLIWVGFKFVLAQGNVEEMKKLKNMLLWIVVGVAVVIGARIIVKVVINTLEATGVDKNVIQSANNALRGN